MIAGPTPYVDAHCQTGGVVDEGSPTAAAVVLAGGSGTRVGAGINKVYLPLDGVTVLERSLRALALPEVGVLLLVVREDDRVAAASVLAGAVLPLPVEVVAGGADRQGSELAALRALAPRIGSGRVDVVLVHDAARPLVEPALVREVLTVARVRGGAVPGLVRDDLAVIAPARSGVTREGAAPSGEPDGGLASPAGPLTAVQTPQGFRAAPLLAAYEQADREGFSGTDTASCIARYAPGLPVHAIAGDARNFKITYPHDLVVAHHALAGRDGGAAGRATVSGE